MPKIFFDGGSALNSVCVYDDTLGVFNVTKLKSKATNNELEYMALIAAIEYTNDLYKYATYIQLVGDSELIVKQMNGEDRVKASHLKTLFIEAKTLLQYKPKSCVVSIEWVPRAENKAGVELEKALVKSRYG